MSVATLAQPNVPIELDQYIVWAGHERDDGKTDKIPCDPLREIAVSPQNAANWMSEQKARELARSYQGIKQILKKGGLVDVQKLGVGFVFTRNDPYWFLDLDNCLEADGKTWAPYALEICKQFPGAAIEVSQSGRGLHLVGRGAVPTERRIKSKCGKVELYTEGRFVAFGPYGWSGDPRTEHTVALTALCAQWLAPNGDRPATVATWSTEPVPEWSGPADDDELISKAIPSQSAAAKFGKKGVTFNDLWTANGAVLGERWPDSGGREWDGNAADAALCQHLAFWTGKDCERMRRLWFRSGLYREKLETRPDYVQRTILRAVGLQREVLGSKLAMELLTSGSEALGDTDGDQFPASELDNANRFVKQYEHDCAYVPGIGWRTYDEPTGVWLRDSEELAMLRMAKESNGSLRYLSASVPGEKAAETAFKFALKSESDRAIRAVLNLSKSALAKPTALFDSHPWLFGCGNGVVDLKSGDLLPHRRENFITAASPTNYVPGALCPRWLKFLGETFGHDPSLIDFVQAALGYSLTGSVDEQCLFLSYGRGANGKSVLYEVVRAVVGHLCRVASFDTFLLNPNGSGPRNDLAGLVGARMVLASEPDTSKRLDEATIKMLTGSEAVAVRYLYKEFFEYKPTFKIWLSCNRLPRIRGTDWGIWRRIRVIPFRHTVPEEKRNPRLIEELLKEKEGILAWLIEGAKRWATAGRLTIPKAIEEATREYRRDEDRFGLFLEENTVIDPSAASSSAELRARYDAWACTHHEFHKMSAKGFGHALKERGFERFKGPKGVRMWRGLHLVD